MSGDRGLTVAMLPGSLCDERLFTDQRLAIEGAGHRVSVVALRPHTSIEAMAAHVADTVQGDFVAIGLSMGAIVAAELIALCPQRLLGLALFDTNLAEPTPDQNETRLRWGRTVRTGKMATLVAQELIPTLTAQPALHGRLVFAMAEAAGSAGFLSDNRALLSRDRDRRPLLEGFDRPLLVACGADDQVTPPDVHRELAARNSRARLELIPRAGHLATIDQSKATSDLLVGWLEPISTEIHTQEGTHVYDNA